MVKWSWEVVHLSFSQVRCLLTSKQCLCNLDEKERNWSFSKHETSQWIGYISTGANQATSPTGASVADSRKRPRDRPKETEGRTTGHPLCHQCSFTW